MVIEDGVEIGDDVYRASRRHQPRRKNRQCLHRSVRLRDGGSALWLSNTTDEKIPVAIRIWVGVEIGDYVEIGSL